MKALPLLFAALLLTACETARYGAGGVNILIMGEDADPDAVPRDSQVFKRVLDALANELNGEGFNVYDETALTLGGFAQGRLRRTDAEIIDIARSLKRPPIDVAVIYTIYSRSRSLAMRTGCTSVSPAGCSTSAPAGAWAISRWNRPVPPSWRRAVVRRAGWKWSGPTPAPWHATLARFWQASLRSARSRPNAPMADFPPPIP